MKLKYLTAQPADLFFAWQTEVYINTFISRGVPLDDIVVVCSYEDQIPDYWLKLKEHFKEASFYFYLDTRTDKSYIPSIQAHILKKHFKLNPEFSEYAIFFHDADFLLTKSFDFSKYLNDSNWYFSDCTGYLSAAYIESKSPELLKLMTTIVEVDEEIVKENNLKSGGAQKLMKNVDHFYWEDVEKSCVNLYKSVKAIEHMYHKEGDYPIQIWCASMWAELWCAWKRGINVEVPKEFDFSWGTDDISKWVKHAFFHNAGVENSDNKLFYKGEYRTRLPYFLNLDIKPGTCSSCYYNEIKRTENKTVLI